MEDNFSYTYSAAQQQEIEAIRKKYLPKEADKLEQLRALHRSAGKIAQSWAITLGAIGTLTLGTGMSLIMTDLAAVLSISHIAALIAGLVMGVLGIALVALAYPLYNRILETERRRIAPEILRLSDELLQ